MTGTRVVLLAETTEYGGAETYVLNLARHLPERFTVIMVATKPVPDALCARVAAGGFQLVEVNPVRDKGDVRRLARLCGAVRSLRPDLIHVNVSSTANNRFGLAAAACIGRPTLAVVHSWVPVPPLQSLVLPRVYRRLDRVIAVSEQVRHELVHKLGLRASSVVVVPNGVAPSPPAVLNDSRPVRIGVLGRLDPLKGVDQLLQALPRVLATGADVEVVVGGAGPDEAALRRIAIERRLPTSFAGFVDAPDAFLDSLDIFCLPSRAEGMSFSLLEAMARGLPVVAFDVGSVREVLCGAGKLVRAGDVDGLAEALLALVGSVDERRRLGTAARQRVVTRYSVQVMADATAALFDDALAR